MSNVTIRQSELVRLQLAQVSQHQTGAKQVKLRSGAPKRLRLQRSTAPQPRRPRKGRTTAASKGQNGSEPEEAQQRREKSNADSALPPSRVPN